MSQCKIFCVHLVLLVCFAVVQIIPVHAQDLNTPVKDKWAVIVGISRFKDPELNLRYAAKDAKDFAHFLVARENFAADHVLTLTDEQATREAIFDAIGDKFLPHVALPDDLVVIYISTHGSPSSMDVDSANYLVAHDTDRDRLFSTGIQMQDLCSTIKERCRARRTLIVLDACHSGATDPTGKGIVRPLSVDADQIAQGSGQLVICSSERNQTSFESQSHPNSIFTYRLIEALQSQGPDTKLGDAFVNLKLKVEEDAARDRGESQTPVMRSKWSGNALILSVKPMSPRQVPGDLIASFFAPPVVAPSRVTAASGASPSLLASLPENRQQVQHSRSSVDTISPHTQHAELHGGAVSGAPAPRTIASLSPRSSTTSTLQGSVEQRAGWQRFLGRWRHNDDEFSGVTIRIYEQDGSIVAAYEKLDGEWTKKSLQVGDWIFTDGQADGAEIHTDRCYYYREDDKNVAPYTRGTAKVCWGPRANQMLIKRQNYGHGYFDGWTEGYPSVVSFPNESGWRKVDDGGQISSESANRFGDGAAPVIAATSSHVASASNWRSLLGTWECKDDELSGVTLKIFEDDGNAVSGVFSKLEGQWAKRNIEPGDFLFRNGKPAGATIESNDCCYYRADDKNVAPYCKGSIKIAFGPKANELKITRQNYEHGYFTGWQVGAPSVVNFPPVEQPHWRKVGP